MMRRNKDKPVSIKTSVPRRPDPNVVYAFSDVPGEGRPVAVGPGVWWLRLPVPFSLGSVNIWLIEDGGGFCLVDCGLNGEKSRAAWAPYVDGWLNGRPITRIIATHFHPDHIGAAAWLVERTGAHFLCPRTEYQFARMLALESGEQLNETARWFYTRAGAPADMLEQFTARGNVYRKAVPNLPPCFERIQNGDLLTIGGRGWRVYTGGGHALEMAALWCEELGLFIAADHILPTITPNISVWQTEPEADPLSEFLETIEGFRLMLPFDALVLPSHGKPFTGLHQRIIALTEHHEDRLDEVVEACASEVQTAADITNMLFRVDLDANQWGFAIGEAIAHLHKLMVDGRITRHIGTDGVARFSAVS